MSSAVASEATSLANKSDHSLCDKLESEDNQNGCSDAASVNCIVKRSVDDVEETDGDSKRLKMESKTNEFPYSKKKVALLLVYSGKGYNGMQRNKGFRTIESDLLEALVKAGVVRPDHIEDPGVKMAFQRAARTDKGVSAAGQVVSLKMFVDVKRVVEKINENLCPQIRVLGLKRTTKGFNSKNCCSSRTYLYITPTFAFAPVDETVRVDYRISENVLQRVQEILSKFKGSHNFHNFTSGKLAHDPSAMRYITDFTVGQPFERAGLEYVVLTVTGQSFMLHQIRKMVGLTSTICRGYASMSMIDRCWEVARMDVPKAPGLGLLLDKLHYSRYNKKFGSDGVHEPMVWDEYKEQIENFKESFIFSTIYETEQEEQSMMKWLGTLHFHHFEYNSQGNTEASPLLIAQRLVDQSSDTAPNNTNSHSRRASSEEPDSS